jgi:hypothetical protein
MLPYPHDCPTASREKRVVSHITLHVPPDLCIPVVRVSGGPRSVLGAAMPETTIHEDRKARSANNHICATTQVGLRSHVQSEPDSATMQRRPYGALRTSVRSSITAHYSLDCFR